MLRLILAFFICTALADSYHCFTNNETICRTSRSNCAFCPDHKTCTRYDVCTNTTSSTVSCKNWTLYINNPRCYKHHPLSLSNTAIIISSISLVIATGVCCVFIFLLAVNYWENHRGGSTINNNYGGYGYQSA